MDVWIYLSSYIPLHRISALGAGGATELFEVHLKMMIK